MQEEESSDENKRGVAALCGRSETRVREVVADGFYMEERCMGAVPSVDSDLRAKGCAAVRDDEGETGYGVFGGSLGLGSDGEKNEYGLLVFGGEKRKEVGCTLKATKWAQRRNMTRRYKRSD